MGAAAVLGLLGELVKGWFQNRVAAQQQKRELAAKAAEFKQQQAASATSYTRQWELDALTGRDIWAQRMVVALILWPLVWCGFQPDQCQHYFQVLQGLPVWYQSALGGVLAVELGLRKYQNMIAGAPPKAPPEAPQ